MMKPCIRTRFCRIADMASSAQSRRGPARAPMFNNGNTASNTSPPTVPALVRQVWSLSRDENGNTQTRLPGRIGKLEADFRPEALGNGFDDGQAQPRSHFIAPERAIK